MPPKQEQAKEDSALKDTKSKIARQDLALKETKPNIGGGRVYGGRRLTSSFDLVEEMSYLFVKIIKARDLAPDVNPFVEVKIGHYKGTTKFFDKNQQNPEWNQVFAFNKERIQASVIEISMRNKRSDESVVIGLTTLSVADVPRRVIPDSTLAPQWNSLKDLKGDRIPGELMFSLWIGTQADESFPDAWLSDSATVGDDGLKNTRSKVYMTPRLWYLRVTVLKARDLVLRENRRSPGYFVKVALGNVVVRSRISPIKSLDPDWNDDLMFVAAEPFEEPLILSVEDRIGDKEECLGKIVIPLQSVEKRIFPVSVCPKWYDLEKPITEGKETKEQTFASRINMSISLDGGYHVLDEWTYYSSDFRPSSKDLWTSSFGVLELGILDAKGLVPVKSKNGRQTTDAYCVAKYGHKWIRTKTVIDSLDPKWNEQYTWEVYDPYTVITIGVFDNVHIQNPQGKGNAGGDPRIGKVRIRLSTLVTDKVYTHSYPLFVLQPKGLRKMGEIQLAVRFTCANYYNMFRTYWQPLLPKMHYSYPLSIYQLESLRDQAAKIITFKLSKAEPSLEKEIVSYMLDSRSSLWSQRRAKVNFTRLILFFSIFVKAWKCFEHIRAWNNYSHSLLFIFMFEALVLLSQFILPVFFFLCALLGLWYLPKRPTHPPHVDVKLSYVDSAHPDEIDEEFDTFPSSKSGNVLKQRYDKLRSSAGRMISVLGDLATQMERLESLLSWRDPRATAIFMVFCVCSCIVFYTFSLKWLVSLIGIYTMRPPKFRDCIPSYPENFLRRLPARTESLL